MRVRPAGARGVHRIAQIGAAAMRAQYEGLVDPVAVESAVAQLYSIDAVADGIGSCSRTQSAEFLVAVGDDGVVGYLRFDSLGPEPELHRSLRRGGPAQVRDRQPAGGRPALDA